MATAVFLKRYHSPSPSQPSSPSTPQREEKKQRIYSPKSAAAHSPGQALYYSDGFMSDLLPGEPTDQELVEAGWNGNWLMFLNSYGLRPNAYGYLMGKKILNKMRVEMRGNVGDEEEGNEEGISYENSKGKEKGNTESDCGSEVDSEGDDGEELERSEEEVEGSLVEETDEREELLSPSSSFESQYTSSFDASPSPPDSIPVSLKDESEDDADATYHDVGPDYNNVRLSSPSNDSQDSTESFDQEPVSLSDDENCCFDERDLDRDRNVPNEYDSSSSESEEESLSGDDNSSLHLGIFDIKNPDFDE